MKKWIKILVPVLILVLLVAVFVLLKDDPAGITEDGFYYSKEDVTEYLVTYGHLPSNFITKKEAKALGWEGGSVDPYKKGGAIGGDIYYNQEKKLPIKEGRTYYVCDIDTNGQSERGAKRLIFSDDGLIYYSPDFYETFELVSGEVSPDKPDTPDKPDPNQGQGDISVAEDGLYYSKDEVALYIHTFGHLPANFITKKEAKALGWNGGNVSKYKEGAVIGGDRFGNNEGLLPKKDGRSYTECDIDTLGSKERGAKRIVFSNDGLVYYTEDHYASFTLLYGEE